MRYIIPNSELLFLDGERTFPMGEQGERRWMELAIIDGSGATVYHSYFNPGIPVDHRFEKKGLTDDILMRAPTFNSQWLLIRELLRCKHVVAWWMDMEKSFFPEQLTFCKKLHCAQTRFSPLVGDYNMQYGNYKSIGMWCAFDMLELKQPAGFRHRATTDVHAMRMIWNWLEATQTQNLLSNVLQERPSPRL
jgi:hypothetical protein